MVSEMLKETSPTHRALMFLALLLSVAAQEDFSRGYFDYEPSPLLSLEEKCSEYFDRLLCRYWDSLEEEGGDKQKTFQERRREEEGGKDGRTGSPEESGEEFPPGERPPRPEKRFTVFRRRHPVAQGYKRGPGFRSWGGKRDSYSPRDADKRTKFASWGGKRTKFTSWGGKRSDAEDSPDKRTTFGSWGGKRSDAEDSPDKRTTFGSWGGKRSARDFWEEAKRDPETPISYDQAEKRAALWNYRALYPSESFKKHLPKRPQFQSWGGKRTFHPWSELVRFHSRPRPSRLLKVFFGGEKRKFSSWGGKRGEGGPDQEPRNEDEPAQKRHTFQNWGGKRTAEGEEEVSEGEEASRRSKRRVVKTNPENVESHSGFNSWGGKRGEPNEGR